MTPSSDPEVTTAYTQASVEAYLRAVAAEKARLEQAIDDAHQRTARAIREAELLTTRTADADEEADELGGVTDAEDDQLLAQLPLLLPQDVDSRLEIERPSPAMVHE